MSKTKAIPFKINIKARLQKLKVFKSIYRQVRNSLVSFSKKRILWFLDIKKLKPYKNL